MTFDGRELAAFLAIVAHGSLGRAAEALHLTQPALSRTVKRLEAQLGAPLFERHTKGMALTPVGQAQLPRATLLPHEATPAVEETQAFEARWAVPPRRTAPFEHLKQTFSAHGPGRPDIVVETRSITVLKALVLRAGFLSWMPSPIWASEGEAGLIGALAIAGLQAFRMLTAFRRRQGLLPAPAVKRVEALRRSAGTQPNSR